jgi:hypothetical protein
VLFPLDLNLARKALSLFGYVVRRSGKHHILEVAVKYCVIDVKYMADSHLTSLDQGYLQETN